MSVAPISAVNISSVDNQGLLSTYSWIGGDVTFGFSTQIEDYPEDYSDLNEPGSDFEPLAGHTQDYLRAAFSHFDEIIEVSVQEANSASTADVLIAQSSRPFIALAYSPGFAFASGDIWLNIDSGYLEALSTAGNQLVGTYEWATLLHEIGHSMGLKHGHASSDENPTTLPSSLDGLEYSLMTYRSHVGDTSVDGYNVQPGHYPQSLMVLDISVLQEQYGANYETNSDDTTYSFNDTTGALLVNGVQVSVPVENIVFRTIWDGGGTDHLDLSNYTTDLAVDLRPGQGTDLDVGGFSQRANLASGVYSPAHISQSLLYNENPESLIENATGGSGDDTLVGNAAENRLDGGAGTDVLFGGDGPDVFAGVSGQIDGDTISDFEAGDRIEIAISDPQATLSTTLTNETSLTFGGNQTMLVQGVAAYGRLAFEHDGSTLTVRSASQHEILLSDANDVYSSQIDHAMLVAAAGGDDVVIGSDYADDLLGQDGSDRLVGGQGDDRLIGGAGSDILTGNQGQDVFVISASDFSGAVEIDTVTDFDVGTDTLELQGFGNVSQANVVSVASGAALDLGQGRLVLFEGLTVEQVESIAPEQGQSNLDLLSRDPARTLTDANDRWLLSNATAGQDIDAGAGDDVVLGGSGADKLDGGVGSDFLLGNGGNDILHGSGGSDRLVGGTGEDQFVFRPDPNPTLSVDTVADLSLADDTLRILQFGYETADQLSFVPTEAGLAVVLNATQYILLEGQSDSEALISSGVFEFV